MKPSEKNPFYSLLLVASVLLVVTVLAYTLVPLPQQPLSLKQHGWQWVLGEVAAVIIFGLLSMGLDHWRQRRGNPNADSADRENLPEAKTMDFDPRSSV